LIKTLHTNLLSFTRQKHNKVGLVFNCIEEQFEIEFVDFITKKSTNYHYNQTILSDIVGADYVIIIPNPLQYSGLRIKLGWVYIRFQAKKNR